MAWIWIILCISFIIIYFVGYIVIGGFHLACKQCGITYRQAIKLLLKK